MVHGLSPLYRSARSDIERTRANSVQHMPVVLYEPLRILSRHIAIHSSVAIPLPARTDARRSNNSVVVQFAAYEARHIAGGTMDRQLTVRFARYIVCCRKFLFISVLALCFDATSRQSLP